MTSLMDAESVSTMTSRSMPIPRPAVGGIPIVMMIDSDDNNSYDNHSDDD